MECAVTRANIGAVGERDITERDEIRWGGVYGSRTVSGLGGSCQGFARIALREGRVKFCTPSAICFAGSTGRFSDSAPARVNSKP